jgi:hypothetical protein
MQLRGTKFAMPGTEIDERNTEQGRFRRAWEVAGWVLLVAMLWGTDLMSKFSERQQSGIPFDPFRLVSEQVTSAVGALVMVLFILQWTRLFPIQRDSWPRAVIGHTLGSILFAFGHYALMVVMRLAWYALNEVTYIWREPFVANLIVEYQKDIKIYIGFVVLIVAYRNFRRSRADVRTESANRLLVQTGTGESVLRFDEIEFLEAARNYISVHANGREYVVRDTMANVQEKLSGGPFVRSHRSFIVNVDRIREIRSADSKQAIHLDSGVSVPLSRGYRDGFRKFITG